MATQKQKEAGSLKLAVASKSTKAKRSSMHSTTVATANNNSDNTNVTFDIVYEIVLLSNCMNKFHSHLQ